MISKNPLISQAMNLLISCQFLTKSQKKEWISASVNLPEEKLKALIKLLKQSQAQVKANEEKHQKIQNQIRGKYVREINEYERKKSVEIIKTVEMADQTSKYEEMEKLLSELN